MLVCPHVINWPLPGRNSDLSLLDLIRLFSESMPYTLSSGRNHNLCVFCLVLTAFYVLVCFCHFQLVLSRHEGGTWREMDLLIPLGDCSYSIVGIDDICSSDFFFQRVCQKVR